MYIDWVQKILENFLFFYLFGIFLSTPTSSLVDEIKFKKKNEKMVIVILKRIKIFLESKIFDVEAPPGENYFSFPL